MKEFACLTDRSTPNAHDVRQSRSSVRRDAWMGVQLVPDGADGRTDVGISVCVSDGVSDLTLA